MMAALSQIRDRFFGRGDYAITMPPMDGVLLANNLLEDAETIFDVPAPDHLTVQDGKLFFSSGTRVMRGDSGGLTVVQDFGANVNAFGISANGDIAVSLATGELVLPFGSVELPNATSASCVTSIAIAPEGACYVTVGSNKNPASAWPKDLLERNAAGSLWHITAGAKPKQIVSGLAWPSGAVVLSDGSVLISESSRNRIISVSSQGVIFERIGNLPGYPAGIAQLPDGFAVSIKAPRNQLIEFILREPDFCREMLDSVPAEYWIAPSLHSPISFLEPLQGGALKQLGIMKPWAPSRSIGLVIELNADFVPRRSFHSRADGLNHGTTSCTNFDGALAVASQGGARILRVSFVGENADD